MPVSQAKVSEWYINGDLCWPGSAPRTRVVGFEFVCGPDQETMVVDIREGPECLYTVTLTSSYACGNASPLINTCNYTIPQLGLIYDLSSLRATTFDYNTTIGDIMYTMSFCGHSNLPLCSSSNNGGMERTPRGTCNPKCWYHLMECLLTCPPLELIGQWSLISSSDPSVGIEQSFLNGDTCVTSSGMYFSIISSYRDLHMHYDHVACLV
jgi:hypothetical protein